MKGSTLISVLKYAGIDIPEGGVERMIKCFNPNHDDKHPSMSINTVEGLYNCFGCGIKGNAYTFLNEIAGLDAKGAIKKLKDCGWSDERIKLSKEFKVEKKRKEQGLPTHARKIYDKLKDGAVKIAEHNYTTSEGELIWSRIRYLKGKSKRTIPFTPCSKGGFWVCEPVHTGLPAGDKVVDKHVLYKLPTIVNSGKDEQIWVVEGEKCVDAVHTIQAIKPCTTLPTKAFAKVDLSPLYRRNVLLIADTDEVGRKYMNKLAAHLYGKCRSLELILPPGEGGYDVADALGEGGKSKMLDWLKSIGKVTYNPNPPQEIAPPQIKMETENKPIINDNQYYRVLGEDGKNVVLLLKQNHNHIYIPKNSLANPGTLISIAPSAFWSELYVDQNGVWKSRDNVLNIADALCRCSENAGLYTRRTAIYGRGAIRLRDDRESIIYNLGNKVLLQDSTGKLTEELSLEAAEERGRVLLESGDPIPVKQDPDAQKYAKELYDAVMSCWWKSKYDARAFLGWAVISLVGGILPLRPILWIVAPAGVGKTYLMQHVLHKLFGDAGVPIADATEAGIAHGVGNESIPVYIDEFEPSSNKQADERIFNILRIATGGEGLRIRGGINGSSSTNYKARFTTLLASINVKKMDSATRSRIYFSRLDKHTAEGKKQPEWSKTKKALRLCTTPNKMIALRTHIIQSAKLIQDKFDDISDKIQERDKDIEIREAEKLAALTAGAGFLSGDYTHIKSQNIGDSATVSNPISTLLTSMLRDGSSEKQVIEWLKIAAFSGYEEARIQAKELSARHGFMLGWGEESISFENKWRRLFTFNIYISCRAKFDVLLRNSDYEGISMQDYLRNSASIKRHTKKGKHLKLSFAGVVTEYYILCSNLMRDLGFSFEEYKDDPPEGINGLERCREEREVY